MKLTQYNGVYIDLRKYSSKTHQIMQELKNDGYVVTGVYHQRNPYRIGDNPSSTLCMLMDIPPHKRKSFQCVAVFSGGDDRCYVFADTSRIESAPPSQTNTIKVRFDIEISNIEVDSKYYSFDYRVWKNEKLEKEGKYDNSHSWSENREGFKKILEDSLAVNIVLEEIV
jgi:hypothetical protein